MSNIRTYLMKLQDVLDPYIGNGTGDDPMSLQARIVDGRRLVNELKVAIKTTEDKSKVLERRVANLSTENKNLKQKLSEEEKAEFQCQEQVKAAKKGNSKTENKLTSKSLKDVRSLTASMDNDSCHTSATGMVNPCCTPTSSVELPFRKDVGTQTKGNRYCAKDKRMISSPDDVHKGSERGVGPTVKILHSSRKSLKKELVSLECQLKDLAALSQRSGEASKRVAAVDQKKSEQISRYEKETKAYHDEITYLREQLQAREKGFLELTAELNKFQEELSTLNYNNARDLETSSSSIL